MSDNTKKQNRQRKRTENTPSTVRSGTRSASQKRNPTSPIDAQESKKLYLSATSPDHPVTSKPHLDETPPSPSAMISSEPMNNTPENIIQPHFSLNPDDMKCIAECLKSTFKNDIKEIMKENMAEIVEEALTRMNQRIKELESRNLYLEEENETLKDKVDSLEMKCDQNEQYSRRNSIRISGIQEKDGENASEIVTAICQKLDNNVTEADIDRCHRVGKKEARSSKPRAIIVKFATYKARSNFYKSRFNLKNSGYESVFFNEDLTKRRNSILYRARQFVKQSHVKKAWSSDGQVLVKDRDDRIVPINSEFDLRRFV